MIAICSLNGHKISGIHAHTPVSPCTTWNKEILMHEMFTRTGRVPKIGWIQSSMTESIYVRLCSFCVLVFCSICFVGVFLCALVLVHSFVILYINRFFFCFSSGGFLCLTGRFMNAIDISYMYINRHKQFVGPFMFCPVKGWESNTMYNNQESVPVVTIEIHR